MQLQAYGLDLLLHDGTNDKEYELPLLTLHSIDSIWSNLNKYSLIVENILCFVPAVEKSGGS